MEIKYRIYKDKVLEMHKLGHSPIQMEKEIPVESTTLKKWHSRLGLEINRFNKEIDTKQKEVKSFNIGDFNEAYQSGLTDLEIANELKISRRHVCKIRQELGYEKNGEKGRTMPNEFLSLDSFGESAFVGVMLGDGCLQRPKGKNTRCTIGHSLKQLEYVKHQHEIFSKVAGANLDYYTIKLKHKGEIDEHKCVRFHFICNAYFNEYQKELYPEGKKIIPKFILDKYNEISLAYHFMDDGSKTVSGYKIATCGFTTEYINRFRRFLESKFNLNTTLQKDKSIYIPAKSRSLFTSLVKPYIIPSMLYKLHL